MTDSDSGTDSSTDTGTLTDGEKGSTQMPGDWRDHIPNDVKEWQEFKTADTAEKFFKQMGDHRSMLGQSVRIPGEDAGDEARSEFYDKLMNKVPELMRTPDIDNDEVMNDVWARLGRPEAATDYEPPTVEGSETSTEQFEQLQKIAHDAGLTKKQFSKLAEKLIGADIETANAMKESQSADQKALATEWGAALEQRTKVARAVAEKTGAPDSLLQMIDAGQADTNTMKWLFGLSKSMGESMPISNQEPSIDTPSQVRGQIDDIMGNNNHP